MNRFVLLAIVLVVVWFVLGYLVERQCKKLFNTQAEVENCIKQKLKFW